MAQSATKQRIAQAQNGANHIGDKERRFFDALKNIFVGVPVEGESGYINLMHIKARYFEKVMEPRLRKKIDNALNPFPDFREELFDKLYTFFRRYFTESGSIGFFFTPYHQSVYEQVYTNEQDVVLFWKTARLYYVKTDRLFQSMTVEVDGFRFHFDVSQLEHKRANEKRELIYAFKERQQDGAIVFTVHYSERGRKTKIDDIRRAIRDALGLEQYTDAVPTEETLQRAFRIFERQSEVDYFLCKDAKSFLREQFDLWMWQYLLGKPGEEPQTQWTKTRLEQLQALKCIAYRVIDYIAAFEDELVKIWNKPKFVLNSHYVITLDRIAAQPGGMEMLERLWAHPNMETQLQEWRELGMVDDKFQKDHVWEHNLVDGKHLHPRYRYLPIDTKYFPDLELPIVALFDNLDDALDGWLIKSENYQALNTILPKFRERVVVTYIDPPFNLGQSDQFIYHTNYKDATWATLLENRLTLCRRLTSKTGSVFVRCDYNGNWIVRSIMNQVFGQDNFRNEILVGRGASKAGLISQFEKIRSLAVAYDVLYWYSNEKSTRYRPFLVEASERQRTTGKWTAFDKGEAYDRPTMRYEILGVSLQAGQWKWKRSRAEKAVQNYLKYLEVSRETGETLEEYWNRTGRQLEFIRKSETGKIQYWVEPRDTVLVDNNWLDISGYSSTTGFQTENSEYPLKRIIQTISEEKELVMDFFLGSGTTVAVAHKLGRKWLGVEMGEHFYTVVLPRMKRVLFYDKSGVSKEKDVKERYNEQSAGGFFKYYELEQFEDALRRTRYAEDDLFTPPANEDPCQYIFLRDLKMLEALEVNLEQGTVQLDLSKLYENIDLSETLSNLTGKWIRYIDPDPNDPRVPAAVVFTDGEQVSLSALDWRMIRPLIWW
jgi:adenine-specific DNA-methyltransferase